MSQINGTIDKAEQIIRMHSDMIYRIALHNLKNPADAEDIFQDVCLSLLTKDAPLNDEAHIKNWLIRVTINKCSNFRKTAWQSRTEPLDSHTELTAPDTDEIMTELYLLPKHYRNVIYLYYYEEYTIPEIAKLLDKSVNTISTQLRRARKRLRAILEEGEEL